MTQTAGEAAPASADDTAARPGFSRIFNLGTFRSLHYREYRLLWVGTLFASSGQWIQTVTLSWLAYQLTGSALMLGAINGFRSLPLLILGPFGGVAADQVDRKKLMFNTQIWQFGLSAGFATLIVTGQVQVWHLFVFTALSGVSWAFNMPVRQSIMPNLVPREDIMNAMALNSAGMNLTRIAGPTVAGLLIALLGPGENFYLQAAMYVGVAWMVHLLNVPEIRKAASTSVSRNLKEGVAFIWTHPTLRTQLSLALIPQVIALPYITLMPVFAQDVLEVGSAGFGMLMAAPGIGALAGTLTIASFTEIRRKGVLLLGAIMANGLALVLFSFTRSFPISLAALALIGFVQMVYMTTNQTIIQLSTPDEMRGRVMGVVMLNQGLLPLGSLFAGGMADALGAPAAVAIMGLATCLLSGGFAVLSPSMRRL